MSKKILITGMNKAQCTKDFFLNQVLKVVPSHYALIRCLEDLGYEVEQRPTVIGEDLSSYDDVVIYLHSPQSFCQNLYTGLYAASTRPDAILAFDDWQVNQIYAGIEGILGNLKEENDAAFREYLIELQDQKYPIEELKKYRSAYAQGAENILRRTNRLLISAFGGGDLSLLNLGWQPDRVFAFNPNPYHYNRTPDNNFMSGVASIFGGHVEPTEKIRVWNFASLVQKKTKTWISNHKIEWPIQFYGARLNGEDNNQRLTEDQMCGEFAKQWGCLMPGYFHSGSGWWRARPLQVADVGSILICDHKEGKVYGEAYTKVHAHDVEQMDLDQLIQTANWQKECLYDNHPLDKSVTRLEILHVLESSR
jgi:hypothetical protein